MVNSKTKRKQDSYTLPSFSPCLKFWLNSVRFLLMESELSSLRGRQCGDSIKISAAWSNRVWSWVAWIRFDIRFLENYPEYTSVNFWTSACWRNSAWRLAVCDCSFRYFCQFWWYWFNCSSVHDSRCSSILLNLATVKFANVPKDRLSNDSSRYFIVPKLLLI